MFRLLAFVVLRVVISSPAWAADDTDICRRIAQFEDAEMLSEFAVLQKGASAQTEKSGITVDVDGDGSDEMIEYPPGSSAILLDGKLLSDIAPEYRSVFATHDGFISLNGEHFGVIRNQGILTMIWRFLRNGEKEELQGEPVCFFDREWKETATCSRYPEERYSRLAPSRPEKNSFGNRAQFKKPDFLEEVFDLYYGVQTYGSPENVDFDNDGALEQVGTVMLKLPAPRYRRFIEAPVAFSKDGSELETTFQNQRVLQYFAREGSGGGNTRISFLIPKISFGNVLIDETFVPVPFDGGAPQIPFRKIYRIQENWPETVCQAEFSWTTVFTKEDLR